MAEGVSENYVEQAIDLHEAQMAHMDAAGLELRVAECERQIAELLGREHRHEYDEADEIEEIEEA